VSYPILAIRSVRTPTRNEKERGRLRETIHENWAWRGCEVCEMRALKRITRDKKAWGNTLRIVLGSPHARGCTGHPGPRRDCSDFISNNSSWLPSSWLTTWYHRPCAATIAGDARQCVWQHAKFGKPQLSIGWRKTTKWQIGYEPLTYCRLCDMPKRLSARPEL
jgi:hypothetical protein